MKRSCRASPQVMKTLHIPSTLTWSCDINHLLSSKAYQSAQDLCSQMLFHLVTTGQIESHARFKSPSTPFLER